MIKNVSKNIGGLKGEITIPADKSISHRAIMFSSLAKGKTIINNFSSGQDPKTTLKLFQNLGIDIKYLSDSSIEVISDGKIYPSNKILDCGNSGTTMRLVSGILSGQSFSSELIGDSSLSKRPMKRIIEPLTQMGAEISSVNGCAPLKIVGQKLSAIDYISPIASAQVKSCILLAGLFADGATTVTEPHVSRNHTELLLKYMGADISVNNNSVTIKQSKLKPQDIYVCGDISSAAYFIAAALIVPNSDVIIKNIGLNPTRTGIIDVVKAMGGSIEILDKKECSGEIIGDIRIKYSQLNGCEISGEMIPRLIDELPVIAVLATQANGTTVIKDAQDLRNKESDRIKSTVSELKKLGADIEETPDGFVVNGKTKLYGDINLESYQDHRLAMSLYVAGLICEKDISINDFEWTNISFPEFEELFVKIS